MRGIGIRQAELEYSVIGSMLVSDDCFRYGAAFLDESVFLNSDNKEIFKVLKKKAEEGESVEKGIVEKWFEEAFKERDKKEKERLEGQLLFAVEFALGSFERFKGFVDELRSRFKKRFIAEIAQKVAEGKISEDEAKELLLQKTEGPEVLSQDEILVRFVKLYENEETFPYVPTYYDPLDQKVRFEYLTIVAARPSIGKTVFALGLLKKQAENGHPVLFFSQELPAVEEIQARLVAMELGKPLSYVKEQWAKLEEVVKAAGRLYTLPVKYISGKVTVPQFASLIYAHLDWLRGGEKPGIVWVDYLQLFKRHRNFQNQKEFIDYAVDVCVELTKELRIPIVLLAQVNREARTGKKIRPTMDQIKGSGDIEQQATNVLVLHRDFENSPDILEVFVDKSRLKGRSFVTVPFVNGFPDFDERFVQKVQTQETVNLEGFDELEF